MRSAVLLAETVATSGEFEPEPEPDPPLPPELLPKKKGASSGMEPDADSLIVCPVAGVPLTVAEKLASGIVSAM